MVSDDRTKTLTYDEVEHIIKTTEPDSMSDRGDQIWTRRMAVALADQFNKRIKTALEAALAQGNGAVGEIDKIAAYFRYEAPSDGFVGDVEGWSPVDTAITVMRRAKLSPSPAQPSGPVEKLLNEIACWSQSEGLLWWQIKAREALCALTAGKPEGTASPPADRGGEWVSVPVDRIEAWTSYLRQREIDVSDMESWLAASPSPEGSR